MTAQDDWQRWCDRFDKLHNGIPRLFHDRGIWRTILAMLDANPRVAPGGFGEYWLGSCYTDSMLIGIRRESGPTVRASASGDPSTVWPAPREWPPAAGLSRRSGSATKDEMPGS